MRALFVAAVLGAATLCAGSAVRDTVKLRPHEEVEPWWKQETIEYESAQKEQLPWEDAFEGLGQFEFLQQYAEAGAEPEEPVAADNTQRVAPKRLECSCSFMKVNTQAEPKSAYHVGSLESHAGNKAKEALDAQSAPATNFVEERDAAATAAAKRAAQQQSGGGATRDDRSASNARRFIERISRRSRRPAARRDAGEWVDRPYPVDEDRAGRRDRFDDRDGFIEERDADRDDRGYRGRPSRFHDRRRAHEGDYDEDAYEGGRAPARRYRRAPREDRVAPYDRYGEDDRDRGVLMEMRQRYPAPSRGHQEDEYDEENEREAPRSERWGRGRREYNDDGPARRRDPYEHVSRWEEGEFRHYDGYEPTHRRYR